MARYRRGATIDRAERAGRRLRDQIDRSAGELASNGVVYPWCLSRTNIDIDDEACRAVMQRYHLSTKRDAVNLALRALAAEPLGLDEARRLRGSGWDGDLEEMRAGRTG